MVTRGTLPSDRSRLDSCTTRRCDDTRDTDKLADHVAGQVSEIAWILVTVDLHLPVRDWVVSIADRFVIIVVVNFLGR